MKCDQRYATGKVICFHSCGKSSQELRVSSFHLVTVAVYIRVGVGHSQGGHLNAVIMCEVKAVCFFLSKPDVASEKTSILFCIPIHILPGAFLVFHVPQNTRFQI